ncbi:MAG: hypothetical protein GWP17_03020 [Aquificales bacterium]|nr:hypothetical protein [Aquificales bacterium]
MNLTQHPEYKKYLSDQNETVAIQEKLTAWVEVNVAAGQVLKTAVSQLSTLFQEYNRVMWQEFPFCQMCLGGCCVVGASEVTPMDAAALTVLGHRLPNLPPQTHHNERACIYLGERGCTWPANWRPLKCMTFYSLGSGDWQLDSSDERYGRLTQALQAVFDEHLANILGKNSGIDTNELAEPIEFAATLSQRLAKQFLPKHSSLSTHHSSPSPNPTTTALLGIAELTEHILSDPPEMADQLLADLEQFEWVVTGHPAREKEILAEINGRYTPHTHKHANYQQFSQHIQQYQKSINKNLEKT